MVEKERPRLVVLAGPTGSGKSALALEVAERAATTSEPAVIINADASQLYADLAILTARPTAAESARADHRLYGVADGAQPVSAAAWAAMAATEIKAAWAQGRLPVLVGGTGLYLSALLDGIAPVPEIAPAIRADVRQLDPGALRCALASEDPAMAARVGDPQRMARALEVIRSTGRSLAEWQALTADGLGARASIEAHLLDPPREQLRERLAGRLQKMLEGGAVDEVARLLARGLDPGLPVMKAIGVRPIAEHLAGRIALADARDRTLADSLRYAKRQRTWFVSGGRRAQGWLASARPLPDRPLPDRPLPDPPLPDRPLPDRQGGFTMA